MKYAVVNGLGYLMDGLTVQIGECIETKNGNIYEVLELHDRNIVVGDREIYVSLLPWRLFVNEDNLTWINKPEKREYDSTNPFGKFISERNESNEFVKLQFVVNELCAQVYAQTNEGFVIFDSYIFPKSKDDIVQINEDLNIYADYVHNCNPPATCDELKLCLERTRDKYGKKI